MKTDLHTQLQIVTTALRRLLAQSNIDETEFLKDEFAEALNRKYNTLKYPTMILMVKHQ